MAVHRRPRRPPARSPACPPPACRCPLRGPGRPLRRAPGPALDLSSWKSWEHSPDTSALDSPILAQSRRDAHLNTRSGAADRSQRWRRSAETAEIDRDGRSRRICGAGGRKWGIWRWVVTLSWSMRGAPPDRPRGRGAVRREEWITTICFVRTRHTFSKICCGNALRAPLIRTRF